MHVIRFCFCKDMNGSIGLVKSFAHGQLTVQFDDGIRSISPADLIFI